MFESSVNSEGIETKKEAKKRIKRFESSVNSEGIETYYNESRRHASLRAV